MSLLLLFGFIGVYLSSTLLHPNTHGLKDNAQLSIRGARYLAYRTIYLSGAALLLQVLAQSLWKMRWMKVVVFAVALLAGVSVSITGHYGAQLVHIEGVGPQGNYMEGNDEREH